MKAQLEKLNRGLVAVNTGEGIFVAWRMFREEAKGAERERLTGTDYRLYRNGEAVALVTDSTNYLDKDGKEGDSYSVAPVVCEKPADCCGFKACEDGGFEGERSESVEVVKGGNEHIDDADEPEVALGVTLPVLARIEEGERAEQQHRQRETGQMDGVIGEGRRKEDVAQQHRYTHGDGTPVIELLGGDAT